MSKEIFVLKLYFSDEIEPELVRTYVKFPKLKAIELERRRNKADFRWSEVPCAFSLCVLDYLIWSSVRRSPDFEFIGVAGDSPASTLHDALSKKDHRFHRFFGYTNSDGPRLRQVLHAQSPRDADVDRCVTLKGETLVSGSIEIWRGERQISEQNDLQDLWASIRRFWSVTQPLAIERRSCIVPEQVPQDLASVTGLKSEVLATPGPQLPVHTENTGRKVLFMLSAGIASLLIIVGAVVSNSQRSDKEGINLSPGQKLLLDPSVRAHISTTAIPAIQMALTNRQTEINVFEDGIRLKTPDHLESGQQVQ